MTEAATLEATEATEIPRLPAGPEASDFEGSPDALALLNDQAFRLTHRATGMQYDRLARYGNVLSKDHKEALRLTLAGFTRQAYNGGRFIYGLPTGSGKTQCVVSWIAAGVAERQLTPEGPLSIAVACAQIEALCELVRDLVAEGVPREWIGLQHANKQLDPKVSTWPGSRPPAGYTAEQGGIRYCSMLADPDAYERPILLITHTHVKGRPVVGYNTYRGRDRSLLVYDETMMRAAGMNMTVSGVLTALGAVELNASGADTIKFVREVSGVIKSAKDAQADGAPQKVLELPAIPDGMADAITTASKAHGNRVTGDAADALKEFLDGYATPMVISGAGHPSAILMYRADVPSAELKSVAVLDASYVVSELYKYDQTLIPYIPPPLMDGVKDFRDVTVRFTHKPSGRKPFADDMKGPQTYVDYVGDALRGMAPGEFALVFTFKQRGRYEPDYVAALKEGLSRRYGINCDERLEVLGQTETDAEGKAGPMVRPRVTFLTWGNQTSRSDLKYCKHVILAGVQYQDAANINARIRGQAGAIDHPTTAEQVVEAAVGELAGTVYQASARGSSRDMVDGRAGAMTLHLPLARFARQVRDKLRKPLIGAKWEAAADPQTEYAEALETYLTTLPEDVRTMSKRQLNSAVRPALVTKWGDQLTRRREDAAYAELLEAVADHWVLDGRSLVRAT